MSFKKTKGSTIVIHKHLRKHDIQQEASNTSDYTGLEEYLNSGPNLKSSLIRKNYEQEEDRIKNKLRSQLWNHFLRISSEKARCNICQLIYSFQGGTTSNLRKHLRKKHQLIDLSQPSNKADSDVDESPIIQKDSNQKNDSSKNKLRSQLWNHFVRISSNKAKCNVCHTIYSFQGGAMSNLRKHLRNKHHIIDLSQSTNKSDSDIDESEVDPLEDAKPVFIKEPLDMNSAENDEQSFIAKTKKSTIWNSFSQISTNEAKCNICKRVYAYKGGSTSNLHTHLRKHVELNDADDKGENIRDFLNNFDLKSDKSVFNSTQDSTSLSEASTVHVQTKKNNYPPPALYSHSLTKQQRFNESLLNFIVSDLHPISILHDEGFSKLMKLMEPSFNPSNSKAVLTALLEKHYKRDITVLKQMLDEATDVTITIHSWMSIENENYSAINAHFITKDWKLLSCYLDCFTYNESYAHLNLSDNIKQIAIDWGISDKIHIAVSNNSPHIVSAVQINGWPHLHCFAHSLDLIVQHGLTTVSDIHHKAKSIVQYFQQNLQANTTFLNTQKQLDAECNPIKLKCDEPTKWSTTFYMFEQLIKLEESLNFTADLLDNCPQVFDQNEYKALKEIHKVLSPFEQIIHELSSEVLCLSKIIIIIRGLVSVLSKFENEVFTETAQVLIKDLQGSIEQLFPSVEYDSFLAKASMLDPRFSRKSFLMDEAFLVAKNDLQEEVKLHIEERLKADEDSSLSETIESKRAKVDTMSLIWQEFDSSIKSSAESNPAELATSELRMYFEEPIIDRKSDPLLWWKNKADLYPTLSTLAKKHLCAVGSSMNYNIVSSKSSQMLCERRTMLTDKFTTKILFLHHNNFLSSM